MTKDLFSGHAGDYAAYRPTYPGELFQFIFQHCNDFYNAWDCGTGNGQVASYLADYFELVEATDISAEQLKHSIQRPNIRYQISKAEEPKFKNSLFDLITVGQAIHWFDIETFFKSCGAVGNPNSLVAIFGYSPVRVNKEIDGLLDTFYYNEIYTYWEAERRLIDDRYQGISFPFEEIKAPMFYSRLTWSLDEYEGYINTWSSVKKFIQVNGFNPVDKLVTQIKPLWNEPIQSVYFPVFLRLGRIKK